MLASFGLITIVLPPWLSATRYSAGLRFTREILMHAARAFPRLIGAIAVLIVLCGAYTWRS